MGLGHDKPQQRTEKDLRMQGPQTPAGLPQQGEEALKAETLPAAQDSRGPASKFSTPTGRVRAGWGPFSQFKQLPLITPLTEGRGEGGGGKCSGWGFWYRD